MNQAQLLDQYIEKLRRDPDALPPRDLDPETAHFARTLVTTRQRDTPGDEAKDRVWNQILFTMHLESDGQDVPEFVLEDQPIAKQDEPEVITLPFLQRYAWAQGAVTAAAAIFVVVMFSSILIYSILPGLVNSSLDTNDLYSTTPRNVEIDPGDSLLYRTVSMFREPAAGGAYQGMSLRVTISD